MSVQATNPITGNTNIQYVEVGNSHVAVDRDSGLIFGQVQLPTRTDAGKWFHSLTGKERPTGWKSELQAVVDAYGSDEAAGTPDIILQSAKDVLDGKTDTDVLVTSLNHIHTGRRMGLPSAVDIGGIRQNSTDIRLGLPFEQTLDEDQKAILLNGSAQDTPNTIAARGGADQMRAATDPQPDSTMTATPYTPELAAGPTPTDELLDRQVQAGL